MRPFFQAKLGGHWTHIPHQWMTFLREMRILPIYFSQVNSECGFENISFLYMYLYFRLYIFVLPFFEYKCP